MLNGGKGYILCHIRQVKETVVPEAGSILEAKRSHSEAGSNEDTAKKVTSEPEAKGALPGVKNVRSSTRILHIKPINILVNNDFDVSPKKTAIPVKESIFPKVRTGVAGTAKKLMEKIGEYKKKKVGGYVELYESLSEAFQ